MIRPMANEWSVTARWIFPVDGPPLERGVLTIADDRIAAVEPHGTRTADRDLGNAAILPGLVNAHTHLDLSCAQGKCPPTQNFTDWLRAVVAGRRTSTLNETTAGIQSGIADSVAYGTTLLGDISAQGLSWELLLKAPIRSVIFYELIGLTRKREIQAKKNAKAWLRRHRPTINCRPGLSPHAPYSVRDCLYRNLTDQAEKNQIALATHLAETEAEIELLRDHSGPLVEFLEEMGAWDPNGLIEYSPALVMRQCSKFNRSPILFIHCNYLRPTTAFPRNGTPVYCPRTHAAFGHPPHPFREFLARGVRVALGTDSLASNPDLDVLAEARFVHAKHPDVAGDVLLRMVTLSGAEALGWADETGSLTPGKSADFIVLPLPKLEARDPHLLILESALPVSGVVFRGQWTRPIAEPDA